MKLRALSVSTIETTPMRLRAAPAAQVKATLYIPAPPAVSIEWLAAERNESGFKQAAPPTRAVGIRSVMSVETPAEYILATQIHVKRVGLLAQELLRRHPALFSRVEPPVLAEFASVHDAAKIATDPAFLAEHNLERPLADELTPHWGLLLKISRDAPNPLVEKVNRVDHAVESAFFDSRGIAPELATHYRLIVEVADKVDRGMSPLSRYEEMGKTAVPVGEYLKTSSNPRDQLVASLAQGLEADYEKLIPPTMNYLDERPPRP